MGLEKNSLRIFYLLCCVALTLASRSFTIDFESLHREWNTSVVETFTVDMIQDGKRQLFNGSIINAISLDQCELNLVLSIVRKTGQNRKMIDLTVDGCKFLSNAFGSNNHIATLVMQFIRTNGQNVPTSCPIKKGWEIIINNVYVDSEMFPPYLPEIVFEAQLTMTYKKALGYRVKALGAIISKNKKKLLTQPL